MLYWRNSDDWGLSPVTDEALRLQKAEEEAAIEVLRNMTPHVEDTDLDTYILTLGVDYETAMQILSIQRKDPSLRTTEEWLLLRDSLHKAISGENKEMDFVDGELLPYGASETLIRAVRSGDEVAIGRELMKVEDLGAQRVLCHLIQRMGPLLGRHR